MAIPDETNPTAPVAPRPSASSSNLKPPTPATASTSGAAAHPPGHAIRRSRTIDETSPLRRRPPMSHITTDSSFDAPVRRSSNFSDLSLSEARDILNPKPQGAEPLSPEVSSLASLALAFALLPGLAGIFFKNGSAVVTDVMLLGLAGLFLHWSVTQPWNWYHSAQGVRVQHETSSETVIEEDSDVESPAPVHNPTSPLDDVPEEEETDSAPKEQRRERGPTEQQQSALNELYMYEVLALLSCFLLPLVAAYLLHAIRSQLSRPSEGLVSNYNLTIFLLVSEARVASHLFKLVHSRTLHLQRVVHANPFGPTGSGTNIDEVLSRLDRLESRSAAEENLVQNMAPESTKAKQEAAVTRDVRNAIQPEVDALNRAVRRYEKKATLLQFQTESRFSSVDARLEDAIALAAAAAKNSSAPRNTVAWAVQSIIAIVLFPFNAILQLLLLPLTSLLGLISRKKQKAPAAKTSRTSRARHRHRRGTTGIGFQPV